MDLQRAKELLSGLADGVDPLTSELPNDWKRSQYESEHRAKICDRTGRARAHQDGTNDDHHTGRTQAERKPSVHAPAHSVLHPAVLRAKACKAGRGMRAGTHPKAVGSVPTGAAGNRPSTRVSRVSRLCPIFRTQPGAYPPETQNRTLRRCAGALLKRQTQKETACRRLSAEKRAASGEAG